MTTAKRLGLAGMALLVFSAATAYYLTMMAMRGLLFPGAATNFLALGLATAMTALVLVIFWRSLHRSAIVIGAQLRNMVRSGSIGLVMTDADELSQITRPMNEFLTATRGQIEQINARNRELEIELRLASAEKNHVEAIIHSISDAVVVTNRFDELILANEAAEKALGFRLDVSLRKNVDDVISDGRVARLIRETRSNAQNMPRQVIEHSIAGSGAGKTFKITLSCVSAVGNEVGGVVAVLHDMTREKEISRLKTDFVSNVSHELKTPLASIKAYTEMLIDGEVKEEKTQLECYRIIAHESDRLHRLIENILNISRIESGLVQVQKEPVDLNKIVREVLRVAQPQAQAKHITLIRRLSDNCRIEADPDMMHQAVMNLVSNAIKYTPGGGSVSVASMADDRRRSVVLEVADDGSGILAAELPHIFDKFYRSPTNSRSAAGTGLGLTMVKQIIESVHGGRISVSSEQGKGSTFSIELPLIE